MKNIRAAVAVTCSRVGDTAGNLKKTAIWSKTAVDKGAAIICFPELNLTGYFSGPGIQKYAEPIPGYASDFMADVARKNNITVLAGMAEKGCKGQVYATHLIVQPNGTIGAYRKLHLGPPEKETFTPGDRILLFEVDGFKFGVQLCYDAHFPELSTRMALDGADAIFIPHASPGADPKAKLTSWMRHLPARAYDNSLFVIACNPCGDNGKGLHFPGVALVLEPSGSILDVYTADAEHLMLVDLKPQTLETIRNHPMRYFLPNRRPDIYKKIKSE